MRNFIYQTVRIKNIIVYLMGVVFGIGMIIAGIAELSSDSVACGEDTQSASQLCVETRDGTETVRDHNAQKADNRKNAFIMLGIGPFVALGTAYLLRGEFRRGRPARRTPAPQQGDASRPPAHQYAPAQQPNYAEPSADPRHGGYRQHAGYPAQYGEPQGAQRPGYPQLYGQPGHPPQYGNRPGYPGPQYGPPPGYPPD
ncbi:hypothetical protein AB0M45_12400 [Nocardia sp. NPDC051787]|uniref:hypothetical protein n=1 Tax=Nocardia sp. NPDC051787 TaxID=3155415 RepID=UPI003427D4BE